MKLKKVYNIVDFIVGKVSMKLWDLGGQTRFRESWEKFCRDSDVIIFVVDSYDQSTYCH